MNDIVGPKYNYADYLKKPEDMNVSSKGNINVSMNDKNAMLTYLDSLIYGNNVLSNSKLWNLYPLGNNFFVKSGTCGNQSTEECKGKDRYLYIRNVPTGKMPCMGKFNPKTNLKGLVPGMLEDTADVNPFALFNNLLGNGSAVNDKCLKQTLPTGPTSKNYKNGISQETKCSPKLKPPACLPELFIDYKSKQNKYKYVYVFIFLFVILIVVVIFNNK